MTKVYLAASFQRIAEVKQYAKELIDLGCNIECCARWVEEVSPDWVPTDGKVQKPGSERIGIAMRDIADIQNSNAVVLLTEAPYSQPPRGGRHFEFGYGYGLGKKCITVGGRENVFHHLPDVVNCETWEDAKQALLKMEFERRKSHGVPDSYTYYTGGISGTALSTTATSRH